MNKYIVTTTIHPPTAAIEAFSLMSDWTLIIAGDLKTPKSYSLKNGLYLSPEAQEKDYPELSHLIGWNTHARRNFALLKAWELGADVVAIVDDDNIPLPGWGEELLVGREVEVDFYETDLPCFDPIGATNYPYLWHRGFPLQLLQQRCYEHKSRKVVKVDVQADFWNGDPDIDAVCRMEHAPDCRFDDACFPLSSNRPAPFNSQNTFISREALQHYFPLPHLTPYGRLSDIWMAYHMGALGFGIVFNKASVQQIRNEHDLTQDLVDEFLGYEKTIDLVRRIEAGTYRPEDFWPERTCKAYAIYREQFACGGVRG